MQAAQTVWRSVLSQLQPTMTPANFDNWLRPTRGIQCEDNILLVGVPTTFGREWLE
ncbi:MAG: DnaA N-terminal domain-containing protein, partial [Chloroflexota bacterium]